MGHQQAGVLQTPQGRGVGGVGVHHHLQYHSDLFTYIRNFIFSDHHAGEVRGDLGFRPGPPDPQVDAGPGELGLPRPLHHSAPRVQPQDARGGHLAPVDATALLGSIVGRSLGKLSLDFMFGIN